jgi:hypothetical protein
MWAAGRRARPRGGELRLCPSLSTSSGRQRRPLAASRRRSSTSTTSRPPPSPASTVPVGPMSSSRGQILVNRCKILTRIFFKNLQFNCKSSDLRLHSQSILARTVPLYSCFTG